MKIKNKYIKNPFISSSKKKNLKIKIKDSDNKVYNDDNLNDCWAEDEEKKEEK